MHQEKFHLFQGENILSCASISKQAAKLLHKCKKNELMKNFASLWIFALAMAMTLSSCEVVGGIFKAGFWTAIIIVVLVVGLILWLVGRGRR